MRIAKWEVLSIRKTETSTLLTSRKLGLYVKNWALYFLLLYSKTKTRDLIG